ncbi:hypothetical protein [Pseudomonas putida]|uniref:Uncharacterized protein n=1 Tax=Pseudomonas putida TaxID=303 RepID=A0A8I1EDH9_PSEPU|nr:hypothetical protein [Pseudomonas putida]MBI6883273.1 hypothetical protein [Pseudomonas putida]
MSNAYVGLADTIVMGFRAVAALCKFVFYTFLIVGTGFGIYLVHERLSVDDPLTTQRGVELCLSHGYKGGDVSVGKPLQDASVWERSSVACYGGEEGVRAFFEFDSVKAE